MSDLTHLKNRWGDPPLVEEYPLSRVAIWALAVSAVPPVCVLLANAVPTGAGGQPIYEILVLLALFQLLGTPAGLVLSYSALFHCGPKRRRSGRGLVWAALGLSYISLVWHAGIFAPAGPLFTYALYASIAVALLHLLVFAWESSFAKHAVAMLLIGGTLSSLLSCAVLQSREQARRRMCEENLRQLGVDVQTNWELQRAHPRGQSSGDALYALPAELEPLWQLPKTSYEQDPFEPAGRWDQPRSATSD